MNVRVKLQWGQKELLMEPDKAQSVVGTCATAAVSDPKDQLIAFLTDNTVPFLLILDDYHVITKEQVHASHSYLVEHLPAQLHIILATRTDPPLPLSLLRARGQILEARTDQLRCTAKETRAFFHKVMGV